VSQCDSRVDRARSVTADCRVLDRVLLAIAGLLDPVGSFDRKLELDLFAERTRRERRGL
jgi:hypothetical protein